jgi:hypothetical protein
VVAQDQRIFIAQVRDQPVALAKINPDPLVLMEGDGAADQHRASMQRQQP